MSLPFQIQKRSFGPQHVDYWLLLSRIKFPESDSDEHATLFAVPSRFFENLMNCEPRARGRIGGVMMREDKTNRLWNCEGRWNQNQTDCEVLSEGTWTKMPNKRHYYLDILSGNRFGNRVVFSWGGPRVQNNWRRGTAYPKPDECIRISTREMPSTIEPIIESEEVVEVFDEPIQIPVPSDDVILFTKEDIIPVESSSSSLIFDGGYPPKANTCPKIFKMAERGDEICGEEIAEDQIGSMKFDVKASLENCELEEEKIIETKFNGHRSLIEYKNGNASAFSESGSNEKTFPKAVANLIANYMRQLYPESINNGQLSVFDGELFLKECTLNGEPKVPEVGVQNAVIKGEHPDLMKRCKFSFQLYDIPFLNGIDFGNEELEARKELIDALFPKPIVAKMSDVVEVRDEDGEEFETEVNLSVEPVLGKRMNSVDNIYDEYCRVTKEGQEGLMIKDPNSEYIWKGKNKRNVDRKSWKKLKEEFDVDASVLKACLGKWRRNTKTNLHLSRYKDLNLYICKDDECEEMLKVGNSGSMAAGGMIEGWNGENGWDTHIHLPLIELLENGDAIPTEGTIWRRYTDIADKLESGDLKEYTPFDVMLKQFGDIKDESGNLALPKCIDIPNEKFIVEVITTDINMDSRGNPHLAGPIRTLRRRTDKSTPNDLEYLKSLYGQEVGVM